jgi:glycosyltransferase involved in cell wall biosynthesis
MTVSIIGTVGVPACYGGFESLVENLLDKGEGDNYITVYCSSKSYEKKMDSYKNANLKYIPLNANGAQSIPYDIWSLFHAIYKRTDVILLLGVSGAIALPFIRLFSDARIITNIDGLEWKRNKWGDSVKSFLKFSEKIAVKYSDIVIADNKAIADYVKSEYGVDSKVIAYGGDHAVIKSIGLSDEGYALALCRIEPENNVQLILEAFSQLAKPLKFIGNWSASEFGRNMKAEFSGFSNITLLDPIYDLSELFRIREGCSFYVHGHSAGGTNPSLVEMMHFKKSILAFDCDYNRATTEDNCEYFSDVATLKSMVSCVGDTGSQMVDIAVRRYTWNIVKRQYFDLLHGFNKKL